MITMLPSFIKINDICVFFSFSVRFQNLEFIVCCLSFIFFHWHSHSAKLNFACIGNKPSGKDTANSRILLQVTRIYRTFLVQKGIDLAV